MGKKDKADSNEEYEFVPEDFDEDAFIHKELVSFRTTVVLFLWGIIAALVTWVLFAAQNGARSSWFLGLAIVVVFFYALKFIYKALKIDIAHYQRREWVGTGFLLFFTWLGFIMLFTNPPFGDYADPVAEAYLMPGAVEAGDVASFEFHFADNDQLQSAQFTVTSGGNVVFSNQTSLQGKSGTWTASLPGLSVGQYNYELSTKDANGGQSVLQSSFLVIDDALSVSVGDLTDPQGTVFVQTAAGLDLWAVYLDVEGSDDHVYLKFNEDFNGWQATANFKGWLPGSNTFTVVAQEKNHFFQGTTLVEGSTLTEGPFNADVPNPGDAKGGKPSRANPTQAPAREVPGVALPVLAVSLVALAAVARHR